MNTRQSKILLNKQEKKNQKQQLPEGSSVYTPTIGSVLATATVKEN